MYPYPLSFPNEVQLTQISSYSSLANAFGTDPGEANRQKRTPRTKCDTVTDTQAIYLSVPPVSNPAYPYPVRNVLNPGTYVGRKPSSMANGRSPSNAILEWNENNDHNDVLGFSSRYDRLPQPCIMEPDGCQVGAEFPAVHFVRREDKGPYSLWDLLTMDTMPDLVAGDLPVLIHGPERWIKVKLIWPGYSRYPFEKRISIKRGEPLTPSLLLMLLAYHVEKFVRWIHNEGAVVERGQEHWTITGITDGGPAMWKNCVITSLQHRTGSIWQPEMYYPRG